MIRPVLHCQLQTGVHCIVLVFLLHLYTGSHVKDRGHGGNCTPRLCFFLHHCSCTSSARLFTLHTLTPWMTSLRGSSADHIFLLQIYATKGACDVTQPSRLHNKIAYDAISLYEMPMKHYVSHKSNTTTHDTLQHKPIQHNPQVINVKEAPVGNTHSTNSPYHRQLFIYKTVYRKFQVTDS